MLRRAGSGLLCCYGLVWQSCAEAGLVWKHGREVVGGIEEGGVEGSVAGDALNSALFDWVRLGDSAVYLYADPGREVVEGGVGGSVAGCSPVSVRRHQMQV